MTRWLLDALADLRGGLMGKILIATASVPVFFLALVIDGLIAWHRRARLDNAIAERIVKCPRGHAVDTWGTWRCSCNYRFSGSAWQPCPLDGAMPDFISCACGASVPSPVRDLKVRR